MADKTENRGQDSAGGAGRRIMESIGARLKKIRLEKGFSLEDARKKTKIHLNILTAIEEDRLVNFSPIYIKGFLKIYCAFLGVSSEEYISGYKKEKVSSAAADEKENKILPETHSALRHRETEERIAIGQKKPFLSADLWESVLAKAKVVLAALILCAAVVILFKLIAAAAAKLSLRPKKIKPAVSLPAKNRVSPAMTAQKETLPTAIRLSIRAREDCWMQLKLDGKTAFQNVLKKGRSESWQAKEKIEFSLGNAGAVDLEVNGRLISNLGRRGQAVKNIVVTRDGLNVSR